MTAGETRTGHAGTSAERVRACLAARGLDGGIVAFEQSTRTAQMAADALGCALGQIAKTLVFVADGRAVAAVVAGDRRGDPAAIAAQVDEQRVRFADEAAVLAATGYAVGSVSPFDLPPAVPVLVDESLARFEVIYPAAGTSSSVVSMTLEQLLGITSGRLAAISR